MDAIANWLVLALAGATFLVAHVSTWAARYAAPKLGFVDKPDGHRKLHGKVRPLMGGVAVFTAVATGLVLCQLAATSGLPQARRWPPIHWTLLASGGLFCLLGLWDDRRPIRARTKLAAQILACLPFALWGRPLASVDVLGAHLEFGPLGVAVAIGWLLLCVNVVNLLDGLDGLASMIGLIAASTMLLLSILSGNIEGAMWCLIVVAAVAGFLVHNWPPARIFLGDAGSLTIGFLVGAVAIELSLKRATGFTLVMPLVLLSVPVFDTLMAILRRKLNGQSIGAPDRGHIHHRLLERGLSGKQTLYAISLLCVLMSLAAIASHFSRSDLLAVLLCAVVLAGLVAGRIFGHHETNLLFQYLRIGIPLFANAAPRIRTGVTLRQIEIRQRLGDAQFAWQESQNWIESIGGTHLEFACYSPRRVRTVAQYGWKSKDADRPTRSHWRLEYATTTEHGYQLEMLVGGCAENPPSGVDIAQTLRHFQVTCQRWAASKLENLQNAEFESEIFGHALPLKSNNSIHNQGYREQKRAA